MQKNNQPFRERIFSQMRMHFKDQLIIERRAQQVPESSVYVVNQGPSLGLSSVRQLVEGGRKMSNEETKATVLRIYNYMAHLLTVLENNQKCRLSWKGGNVRGRVQRQNKIDLKVMQSKKVMLVRLVEQCKHCISSKSQLLNFILNKKGEIFEEVNTTGLLYNVRQVYLLEKYQRYSLTENISEEKYLQQYDWLLQNLLHYHNFLKVYLENKVEFSKLNQRLYALVSSDQINTIQAKMGQLIKFTLNLNLTQVQKAKNFINSVLILKKNLIEAVVQAYYLGFMLKNEIKKMQDALKKIQQNLVEHIKSLKVNTQKVPQTNKMLSFLDNFDQRVSNQLSNRMDQLQFQFNNIYNFIDNQKGNVFVRFYNRKFNKRMIRVTKIDDTLTNIYKLLSNADYAESIWLEQQKRAKVQKINVAIQQKMKELISLKKEIKVLNQVHFKLIFEEIQRVSIFVHQYQGYSNWNHSLIDFQMSLINQCLFDSNGRRIKKLQSLSPHQSKSRTVYNITRQDVFGQTILEIIEKSESLHASRVHNQEQFDKYAVVKETKEYFEDISVGFGQRLLDQHHFKAHFLPKLIRKLQRAFELTPYSEQPLNLQISYMLQSLKLLPYIIKTEVNEKKLNLLVYPKLNLPLLNELKDILITYQQTLIKVCSQINNNPIRKKAIHQKIISFLESRLTLLFDLMEQLKKLDGIIKVMEQSTLVKESYQISEESTYNIILKMLLVQKQLKAYLQQNKDRKIRDQGSKSGLKLINQQFLEYMIKSCSFLFQKDKNIFTPNLLSNLLGLSQQAKSCLNHSNQLISSTLNYLEENRIHKATNRIEVTITETTNNLNELLLKLERLYVQAKKYSPIISSQQLKYELLRLQQFLMVLRQGSQTRYQVFDSDSKQLISLLADLHF